MLDLNPIKKRLANPPMYRGVVMGNDLIVDIAALVAEVEKLRAVLNEASNWHSVFPSGSRQFDIRTSGRLFTKLRDALN